MADKMRLEAGEGQVFRVGPKLYHNLYHRPPALTSAHERRIGQIDGGHAALTEFTLNGVAAFEGCVQAGDGIV